MNTDFNRMFLRDIITIACILICNYISLYYGNYFAAISFLLLLVCFLEYSRYRTRYYYLKIYGKFLEEDDEKNKDKEDSGDPR